MRKFDFDKVYNSSREHVANADSELFSVDLQKRDSDKLGDSKKFLEEAVTHDIVVNGIIDEVTRKQISAVHLTDLSDDSDSLVIFYVTSPTLGSTAIENIRKYGSDILAVSSLIAGVTGMSVKEVVPAIGVFKPLTDGTLHFEKHEVSLGSFLVTITRAVSAPAFVITVSNDILKN